MRFRECERGEPSSESDDDYGYLGESFSESDDDYDYLGESSSESDDDYGYLGESSSESDDDYGYLVESSIQAERRFKHSSKNHMKPKSYSKSFTLKNSTVHRSSSTNFKNHMKHKSGSKKTLPKSNRRQTLKRPRQLYSSSDDDGDNGDVVRMRGLHRLEKGDRKRRKLHPSKGDGLVVDSDYIIYLKRLIEGKEDEDFENDIIDIEDDEDSIEQEEEEEDSNEDIHVDMDREFEMNEDIHMDVDREIEMDDDVRVNVDREMEMDVNGIDVGDDPDPEYKMFLENLREDGKSYVLEMKSEEGNSVFVKYEEPLWPPSCSKGKSMPVDGFHPLVDEDSIEQEEEEEDRNEDIHVDMDRELEMNDDVRVNVDREMEMDIFNGIDVGDDPDPEYKMFLENLREDGKSYVLEMESSNGNSVFIKYEEPLWPPTADDMIPPIGEHNKVTASLPEKSSKDGFPSSKDLKLEDNSKNTISDPGSSVKVGLSCCKDPANKRSCDSKDEEDLGTDCSRLEYEKKLQKCIDMPYNGKEFADKWKLASRVRMC